MMRKRLNTSEHDYNKSSFTLKFVTVFSSASSRRSRIEESTAEKSITEQNKFKILKKKQKHKGHHDAQLQDDLNKKAITKGTSNGYHELLVSVIDELKGDISTLQYLNAGLEKSVESYKDSTNELKMENSAMKTQIEELKNQVQSHKIKAFKSESDILDLRAVVAAHGVHAKMTEGGYYMRKLNNFMEQPNVNVTENVHRNCDEFYNYVRDCIAMLENLEATYQRLKNHLQQGHSIDISELDVQLPVLPKLCNEVSQYTRPGFQVNNRFEVPSRWFFEAPPPYSRNLPKNEAPCNNGDQLPSQREAAAPHKSECEVTLTSEFQAPLPGSASLNVPRTVLQVSLNNQSLNSSDNESHTLLSSELQASPRSETHGASGNEHNISTGNEFHASSVSEHYGSPKNESHASSGRELHPSSGRESHSSSDGEMQNFTRSELHPATGSCTSQGSSVPQIPPSSLQFRRNGFQAPQIIMSRQLTRMMQRLQYTPPVLRPQSSVQQP